MWSATTQHPAHTHTRVAYFMLSDGEGESIIALVSTKVHYVLNSVYLVIPSRYPTP